MEKSESVKNIIGALASFHAEVSQPEKKAKNPHFGSLYVTLDELVKVINKTAVKHGIVHTQEVITTENGSGVATTLWHTSGEYIAFEPVVLPSAKQTPQQYGSSITYARRYALSAAFGLASEEDDDGNAAQGNSGSQKPKQKSSQQPKVANMQQKDQIAKAVKELSELRDAKSDVIYSNLGISILEKTTETDAQKAIEKLNKWLQQARKQEESA